MPAGTAPTDTAVSLQSLHALLYMLVRKQMILTIFVVAVTLGAETEFQIVSVQLRSAADRAFVPRNPFRLPCRPHLLMKFLLPLDLPH